MNEWLEMLAGAIQTVWVLGALICGFGVFPWRAGLLGDNPRRENRNWREWLFPNWPFFGLIFVKSYVWPVVLVRWLIKGMPPSPWVATCRLGGQDVRRVVRVSNPALANQDTSHLG